MTISAPQPEVMRRAVLAEVLLSEDVAAAMGVSLTRARELIVAGACGPWSRVGRRLRVRREAFLAALRQREVGGTPTPVAPVPRAPLPPVSPRILALLRGKRRQEEDADE